MEEKTFYFEVMLIDDLKCEGCPFLEQRLGVNDESTPVEYHRDWKEGEMTWFCKLGDGWNSKVIPCEIGIDPYRPFEWCQLMRKPEPEKIKLSFDKINELLEEITDEINKVQLVVENKGLEAHLPFAAINKDRDL
jgi:hypothetical protein